MEKVGLILEGGGMRGVFTAGVLDFFLEKNLNFDSCIGVSAGACHACSYLSKQKGRAFAVSIDYLDDREYCGIHSLLKTGDLFGAKMLYEKIPLELNPVDTAAFSKNETVFQAVVTNCLTAKSEYPVIKDLIKDTIYIRASSSLPTVSKMVYINKIPYLDGGITDSIPLKQSVLQGVSKNVVVLTRNREYRKNQSKKIYPLLRIEYKNYPQLIEKMMDRYKMYNETLDYIYEEEKKGNVFVIQPSFELPVRRVEKNIDKLKSAYKMGYNETKYQYDNLTTWLENIK